MAPDPSDVASLLQQHGRSLRALALELVREPGAVDDALQETWLRTVQHPPQREGQALGWLTTVLRHVVFRSHRGERRRAARERVVAREPFAEDPAAVVARSETAERVLRAVRALDEPYRAAIWQRYFEDLPPAAIAARSGVPVATVKSRLQRGLQQLRERLGKGGESSGWRGALALAFGFDLSEPAATAGTVAAAGGVTMALWTKVVGAAVVAVLVAAGVWSSWPRTTAQSMAERTASVAQPAARTAAPSAPTTEPVAERAVVAGETTAPVDPLAASLRGRCVDGSGAPLADCVIRIHGAPRGEAMDEWLRDQADPDWRDLERTTGPDGVFAFEFWPPPPIGLEVRVEHRGSGPLVGSLRIAPGTSVDVGDVRLLPGIQVVGRVLDRAGHPVAETEIRIARADAGPGFRFGTSGAAPPPGVAWAPISPGAWSDAAGAFRLPHLLAPGSYRASLVEGSSWRTAATLELAADRPIESITLVSEVPADTPTIRGYIVDEHGRSLRDAHVCLPGNRTGSAIRAFSGEDGRFHVRHEAGDPDTVSLSVLLPGYATYTSPQSIAWGAVDERIVLTAGGGLTVHVADERGRTVDDYTVRAVPVRTGSIRTREQPTVRARGPFANGIATVSGITEGSWRVGIEFARTSGLATQVRTIACDGRRSHLEVTTHADAQRLLRVVTATGDPVEGARIESLGHLCGALNDQTDALSLPRFLLRSCTAGLRFGLLVTAARTGVDGTAVLRGDPTISSALRIYGPNGEVHFDPAVDLMARRELVVTLARGATLIAQATPPAGIEELRRRAHIAPGDPFSLRGSPTLALTRGDGEREQRFPAERSSTLGQMDAQGRCELAAIPPGTWRVGIEHWRVGTGSMATWERVDLAEVTLVDGETRTLALDLEPLLPGTLEGQVLHDGAPLVGQTVTLRRHGDNPGLQVTTDAEGRFELQGPRGTYALSHWSTAADGSAGPGLVATNAAELLVGRTTRHTFVLSSGALQISLRDAVGSPVVGVRIWSDDGIGCGRWLTPTDDSGVVTTRAATGTVTLQVLPERLQSPDAQSAIREQAGAGVTDFLAPHRLTLGTATVRANETSIVDLRLPATWRR